MMNVEILLISRILINRQLFAAIDSGRWVVKVAFVVQHKKHQFYPQLIKSTQIDFVRKHFL